MSKIKIIIRNIVRQKLNSGVIITSLSVGIACLGLITVFISLELNTDSFQKDKNRIYALKCTDPWIPDGKMYQCRDGSAEYMKENFSQVENYCRLASTGAQKVIINDQTYFDHPGMIAASVNFFDFFSYALLTNNQETCLESPNDLVISVDLARKYFGEENPLGKLITIVNGTREERMVVKGLFRKPFENSQLKFDMVRQIKKGDSRCYVKLASGINQKEVEKLFEEQKANIPSINTGAPGQFYLVPMKKVYFDTSRHVSYEASRDMKDLWIALIIGLVIFSVASFNYLGLLNNNLLAKSKIFAVQRVHGGSKLSIILDFMAESLIMIISSIILGFFIMLLMIPFFNNLTNTHISVSYMLGARPVLIQISIIAVLLLFTFLFVAFMIRINIDFNTLKPSASKTNRRIQLPAFNIFQIASSLVLIVFSIVILKQTNYISEKPIGLDKQVIEVKIPGEYGGKMQAFKEEMESHSSVSEVSVAGASPVLEHFLVLLRYTENGVEKEYVPAGFSGDENYISTLGIQIIDGAGFSENVSANKDKCLINESLAKLFPGKNLIGSSLPGMENQIVTGIVRDFNYSSLKSIVEPAFISYNPKGLHLMVKPMEGQIAQARLDISGTWKRLIPDYPLDEESIGDRYEWLHQENRNYIRLIGACCVISLFLAMIGLFAISVQTSIYRVKEIGIRKVNGAKILEVMELLNRDYVKWVVIAFVVATPVSWYLMHKWLQAFAYKTDLSWWIFALAGLIALGIALLTVSWQSWRAAVRNPVEALRYE
jgi:putative ABC transport system permease protein